MNASELPNRGVKSDSSVVIIRQVCSSREGGGLCLGQECSYRFEQLVDSNSPTPQLTVCVIWLWLFLVWRIYEDFCQKGSLSFRGVRVSAFQ